MSFNYKERNNSGLDVIVLSSFVGYLAYYAISFALNLVSPGMATTSWGIRLYIMIQSCVMFLFPAIYSDRCLAVQGENYTIDTGLNCRVASLIVSALIVFSSIPFVEDVSYFNRFILDGFNEWGSVRDAEISLVNDMLMNDVGFWGRVFNIIAVGCVVGVSEEFYFRGIIQNFLLRVFRRKLQAIMVAAAIFSIFHLQPSEFLSRFVLGFMIGYAYYVSGNIWIPVTMHVTNNVLAILLYHVDISDFISGSIAYSLVSLLVVMLLFIVLGKVVHVKE